MHGIGGGAWSWAPQAEALSERCRCYLWEARGHGAAAPAPAGVTLSDYYRDGREALDLIRAGEGASPVVAAHSMGGLIAMALAADDPAAFAGLFLLEPVYAPGGPPRSLRAQAPAFGAARLILTALARALPAGGFMARGIARAFFRGAFSDRGAMERAWPEQRRQPIVEFPAMLLEAFEGGFSPRAYARELRVPTLLLEGSIARRHPRFPGLVDDLRFALGSRFRYEVAEGGHYLQLDRPELVTRLLHEFIAATFLAAQGLPA
jgi:pimeloyl-ACP methyl ester carboxylesterase